MNRLLMTVWVAAAALGLSCTEQKADTPAVFAFTHNLTLHGSPQAIYDALTGDISGWWDHSFSDQPYKLYIEARPGGGDRQAPGGRSAVERVVDLAVADAVLAVARAAAERGRRAVGRRAALRADEGVAMRGVRFSP